MGVTAGPARARPDVDRRSSGRRRPSWSHPTRPGHPVVWVRTLLGRAVTGPEQQHLGHVQGVLAVRPAAPAVVTGLVVDVGGVEVIVPISAIQRLQGPQVVVDALPRTATRQPDELALARDVLRKPVLTESGAVQRVADIALRHTGAGWTVWTVDTGSVLERFLGSPRRLVQWDALVGRRLALPRAGSRA